MSRRDQLVRTFALLRLLARANGASMLEMEAELGVSKRTLQRDMIALEAAGFPMIDVGNQWPPRKRIPADSIRFGSVAVGLADLLALRLAQRSLGATGCGDLADVLGSLLDKLSPLASAPVRGHLSRMESMGGVQAGRPSRASHHEVLASLVMGVAESRIVRVDYASRSQRGRAWRDLEPYALVPKRSGVYLVGPEAGKPEVRHYLLDRFLGVELTPRRFVRPSSFSADRHFGEAFGVHRGPPQHVRLRFSAEAAAYVRGRSWHPSQQLIEAPDGSIDLSMRVGGMIELKSWIQSFGAAAMVLEPASLAADIQREARLVVARGAERHPGSPRRSVAGDSRRSAGS